MASVEQVKMARPGIPIELPKRRVVPDIVNPVRLPIIPDTPIKTPVPTNPIRVPKEPVPV